jgi:seryl-tRNA synthetase
VHQFTKVEMFIVAANDFEASNDLLWSLVELQMEIADELGLHYKLLDMPTLELGVGARFFTPPPLFLIH